MPPLQVATNFDYLCAGALYNACVDLLARAWDRLPPATMACLTPPLLRDLLSRPEMKNGDRIVRLVAATGVDNITTFAGIAREAIEALRYQPEQDTLWHWLAGGGRGALHAAATALLPPRVYATAKRKAEVHQCSYCYHCVGAEQVAQASKKRCSRRSGDTCSFALFTPHR
jgi:hypothetical protein